MVGQLVAPPACRHRGQPRQPRTARQSQQDGFDLIVGVLRQSYVIDSILWPLGAGNGVKRLVTGTPGGIFRAFTARCAGIDAPNSQRYTQAGAQGLAMVLETVGCRLQAVMYVHRAHLTGPLLGTGQQQGGRIGAAAERHGQRQAGLETSQRLGQGLTHGESLAWAG